ncbi:DUF554 family protein [Dellaglioa algida]|uniref:Membrane protein n=1 Tax=Dellaglioa algida TaxID=105612 RepID=A0A2C8EQA9_9LACO|nr:DUF554 family protein [Dellaglioa algida]MDK1716126.1 DUF554 domain-containing protein [Dellaglioa algida]MDK1717815.1 DUF554 domain-containing protein [Dellaglioa algida]MDK1719407.1 DUF554 domain-containing protein [Dellaglioa algida]MDK1721091.1 DUF554 domain-containing protein [Dellaglioa algida]MDK1722750.1 DUF554 domain-containing protein [Dellaglioa algida]
MFGSLIGTFTDSIGIIVASIIGSFIGKKMSDKYKNVLLTMLGFIAFGVGIQSITAYMPKSHYAILFIISLVVGTTLGTWWDLEGKVNKLSAGKSEGLGKSVVTEVILSTLGALPIVGSIMAATSHDFTFLFVNASLDFVMVVILAATSGIGMMICAPIVFIFQFIIILIATFGRGFLTDPFITEIAILGGFMVAASGLSLLQLKDLKATNMMPALLVPIVFFAGKLMFNI